MKSAEPRRAPRLVLAFALLANGCATSELKNTKKLAREGHVSLYKNGAFRVPHTSIALIPAGPDAWDVAMLLMKVKARASLLDALGNAAESVYIVSEGTKLSYRAAKEVGPVARAGSDIIKGLTRPTSTLLVYRSSELGKSIVGKTWKFPKAAWHAAGAVAPAAKASGDAISEVAVAQGTKIAADARLAAGDISRKGALASWTVLENAEKTFVMGYVAVPANMKRRGKEAAQALSDADFTGVLKEANQVRSKWSERTAELVTDTVRDYPKNVAKSFHSAGREFAGYRTTGVSFAMLRSLRWVLQGAFGNAVIVPAAHITAASLGYIGVNMAAFPCLVVVKEGKATAVLAVEVGWDAAKAAYDLTAPSGVAAVAAVYGLLEGIGTQAAAGATFAGGSALGYGTAGLGKAAGVMVKTGGLAAGKAVQYIGVPLASAGVVVGGGTIGAVVGGGGVASGKALRVGGEAAGLAAKGFGNILSGAVLAGGTAASVGVAGAYDVYQLTKGVLVPAGYELAGGIILDYDTLAQLGAQSILAAADCSYMVLSLEGPRWALYAVKGKTGNGESLPAGAVVDLKKMQAAGEDIYNIPVSDEEMRKVVDSVYDGLPELPSKPK